MKMLCKLQIDLYIDRERVVMGLVDSGYIVKVEGEKVVVYEKEEVKPV